ncbi:MAG: hypothetical protein PCALPYG88_2849 [uncultured Paraburkholderia sp.]|nr:MAG: hypothetical protein PCALPYG08_2301 [uncultured Paraburkholderia sp.]CAH2921995.1 MAG: hypothetical protein PCALPYG88_2849 [uncultured Paraburkholderia sp.]
MRLGRRASPSRLSVASAKRAAACRALLCFHKHAGAGKMAGELPERARLHKEGARCRRAHANTASNNDPTRRGFCRQTFISLSSPLAGAPTGRVTGGSKAAVVPQREVRAGGASFPAGGVSPHFDVAKSCTFYKTPWAHAVFSQLAASYSRT